MLVIIPIHSTVICPSLTFRKYVKYFVSNHDLKTKLFFKCGQRRHSWHVLITASFRLLSITLYLIVLTSVQELSSSWPLAIITRNTYRRIVHASSEILGFSHREKGKGDIFTSCIATNENISFAPSQYDIIHLDMIRSQINFNKNYSWNLRGRCWKRRSIRWSSNKNDVLRNEQSRMTSYLGIFSL